MPRFGRVLSAMVTPFDDEGALDLDVAAELARYLQGHGHDGLVIAGTTGEAPVLTDDERLSLFAAVIEAVTIPVVAGTGTNDTAPLGAPHQGGAALGAAGVLAVCPYYNRPSQAGIEGHMRAIADGERPAGDGVRHPGPHRPQDHHGDAAAAVPRGAEHRRPEGRRRPTPARRRRSSARRPTGFEVYSGDDLMTLPLLASGIVGTVGVATHWTGPDHQEMFDLWEKGDIVGARLVNSRMLESFAFETGDDAPNPIPDQGDDAPPRHPRRPGPPADGSGAGFRRRDGARGDGEPATLAGCVPRTP